MSNLAKKMTQITILENKKYISTSEAADKYNYCLRSIRRWAKRRKVKGFKHAGKWYVYEPSLKLWIDSL